MSAEARKAPTRQESMMGSRVSKHMTRLFGAASVEASERRPSLMRLDLNRSDQRLFDNFRLFHAHRLGGTSFRNVSKIAGFTDEQCQTWLGVSESKSSPKEAEARSAGRRESVDFAWLLGLYAAVRRSPAGESPRPLRVRLDLDEAKELSFKMKALFGREPSLRQVDDQYDVFFGSKELSRSLHDMTFGNTEVPWEHLVTATERKTFLASFLKRRCSLSAIGGVRPILAIGKRMAPSLRHGLLFLFAQLGIYPAFDDSRIFLQALPELQKVLEVGLIASEERSDRLTRLVKHAPYDSLDIEVDLYYRVLAGEDSERVPAETRRRWLLDELPPKIKRVERIAVLLSDSADPEVVGFLFRGFNMLPADARELAKIMSLQQILGIILVLKRAKIPRDHWSQWLTLSPEEISQKLGGESSPKIRVNGRVFRLTPRARMRYLQAYGLQPSEYQDFSVCLEHIRDELSAALTNQPSGTRISSKSLVFSLQGNDIQSIRLVSGG